MEIMADNISKRQGGKHGQEKHQVLIALSFLDQSVILFKAHHTFCQY